MSEYYYISYYVLIDNKTALQNSLLEIRFLELSPIILFYEVPPPVLSYYN